MNYKFVDNRVSRDINYSPVVHACKEYDFGLIEPKDDPGIIGKPLGYSTEQIAQFNTGAADKTGFQEGRHLPKGFFRLEGQDEINPEKENLVISFTEDEKDKLLLTLKGLDKYFRSGLNTVEEIKKKFNVFIAWSTSLLDAIKTLGLIKDKIGDWTKTQTLFLNDCQINIGTGPYLDTKRNGEGGWIQDYAFDNLELPYERSRTIYQTGDRQGRHIQGNTDNWLQADESEATEIITALSEEFKKQKAGDRLLVDKLHHALSFGDKSNYNGVRIPIEAFVKSLS